MYSRSLESGSALRAFYISKYLSKLGHDVEYIQPMKRLPLQMDFPISLLYYISKTILKRYDLIFVIKPYPNTCIPAILKKNKHTKIILDIDDLDYAYRKGFMSYLGRLLQQPLPQFFDIITVHNISLFNLMVNKWSITRSKVFFLPQGVDLELFNEKNVDKNLKKKLNLENKKIIVFMGHLDVSTDLKPILKAMRIVSIKIKNAVLLVVGGGPFLGHFKKITKQLLLMDKVIFIGQIDKKKLPSFVYLGDVCVVYYEDRIANHYRTSMKLREYLAMKKKVVCNDIGDLKTFKDYTNQSRTEIEDFAEKIIISLENDIPEKVEDGYKFVYTEFSWENLIGKFEAEVINSLNYKI